MFDDLMKRVLGNNLADFAGAEISGRIPVREGIVNDLIAAVLAGGLPGGTESAGSPGGGAAVDANALLSHVKQVAVSFEDGQAVVVFEVKVGA